MATLIGSQAKSGISPREIHAGVNAVYSIYSLTATLSAGDIIQMIKLPDGARIVDVAISSNVNPFAMAGEFNVGISGSTNKYINSVTLSASLVFRTNKFSGFGSLEDISDAAATRYTMVQIEASTGVTGTKSGAISLMVLYQMDQQSLG